MLEASTMRFIGDKPLVTDPATGDRAGGAVLYSIKAGPQLFIADNIALSATYGPVWHRMRDFQFTLNGGFQASLTGYMGPRKKVVARLFYAGVPARRQGIQYAGAAAGFRF